MSAITIENDLVHYEVLGRGRPVIFVHGWLGSWRYWVPAMQQLSTKYRTYALDLWGFGDSGKDSKRYDFKDQVQLLNDFMEKMGIAKAALVGHALGAAICLRYASMHPDQIPRMALISPPIFDLGGLDDAGAAPQASPVPMPVVHAPVSVTTPAAVPASADRATNTSGSAPVTPPTPAQPAITATPAVSPEAIPAPSTVAAPAAPATSSGAAPALASTTPATPGTSAAPGAKDGAPASTPAPASPATPSTDQGSATPAPASATPASTPPAPPMNTDTIPRNPFRGLGDTPDEILARLQAKNALSSAGTNPSSQPSAPKPASPALPVGIGTPLSTKGTATLPAPSPNASLTPTPVPLPAGPVRTDAPNPLLRVLTGKPIELLNKFVDRDMPDLDKLRAEVEKTEETAISRSAQSFNGVNLAVELRRLPSPTLILHGRLDPLLAAPSDELLKRIEKGKPAGHLLAFVEDDLHHFPMLEVSAKFNRLLLDFFDAQDLNNVQFKDQWKRTMR
ncbi:MAG TPA: alpha/beta fold hydrolase [Aggregatilineales bacterium]|nr:alpha/beta fold hydrolase [Aggregatilineales bacterium]